MELLKRFAEGEFDAFEALFRQYQGEVVKSTGDGLFVVFQNAAQLPSFAIDAHEALKNEDWNALCPGCVVSSSTLVPRMSAGIRSGVN